MSPWPRCPTGAICHPRPVRPDAVPFLPLKALAFAARYPLRDYLSAVAAGRLPRYALLAWLGAAYSIPVWLLLLTLGVLLIPSLGAWIWQRVRVNSFSR